MKKYAKSHNYADLPRTYSSYESSEIVILPVPFDKTSTWVKGADRGPEAIIEASTHMELYDIETGSEPYRKGICTADAVCEATPAKMIRAVYASVKQYIGDQKFVVTVGGEHTVSIGAIKAHSELSKHLSILHLDAHTDRRENYRGSKYNHACVMSRVAEFCPTIVSVGIRSMDSSEREKVSTEQLFPASLVMQGGNWIQRVLKQLTKDVYMTIDLDVFDPSIVPSTGTPEPGGLDWYQVTALLMAVAGAKRIRGFDVVELCPSENKSSDFLAAKLIYKLLGYVFCPGQPSGKRKNTS
jgi:agmatinase